MHFVTHILEGESSSIKVCLWVNKVLHGQIKVGFAARVGGEVIPSTMVPFSREAARLSDGGEHVP